MNDSEISTLLTRYLVHMQKSGFALCRRGCPYSDPYPIEGHELEAMRDEFIAQLDKPEPVLIAVYSGMEYGGHEVQMKHPGSRLELEDGKFYVYERQ